jgi:uncharacterized phage protein (predicted DNA packaging)
MEYLTIELIKHQLRIDSDCENDLLEFYGRSAEQTVLNHIGRTYMDLIMEYGEIPDNIIHATLMLVDNSYKHRSPVEPTNLSAVPYTFDSMLMNYIKLSD